MIKIKQYIFTKLIQDKCQSSNSNSSTNFFTNMNIKRCIVPSHVRNLYAKKFKQQDYDEFVEETSTDEDETNNNEETVLIISIILFLNRFFKLMILF